MKPTRILTAAGLAVLFVLASCSTLPRTTDEGGIAYVVCLVNTGRASKLASLSASPFLLDGEIIALPDDTAAFWEGFIRAKLKLEPDGARALPVGSETWREFGSTRDVQVFFQRHVEAGSRQFEIPTTDGRRVLILYWSSQKSVRLYGFKGPF